MWPLLIVFLSPKWSCWSNDRGQASAQCIQIKGDTHELAWWEKMEEISIELKWKIIFSIFPKMWKSLFHFQRWLFLREDFCCNISSFCTESNLLWGVDKKWHWLKINGGLSRWRRLPWEKKSVCSAALPPHRSASLFSRLELLKIIQTIQQKTNKRTN